MPRNSRTVIECIVRRQTFLQVLFGQVFTLPTKAVILVNKYARYHTLYNNIK
jgi:hypothetical protein